MKRAVGWLLGVAAVAGGCFGLFAIVESALASADVPSDCVQVRQDLAWDAAKLDRLLTIEDQNSILATVFLRIEITGLEQDIAGDQLQESQVCPSPTTTTATSQTVTVTVTDTRTVVSTITDASTVTITATTTVTSPTTTTITVTSPTTTTVTVTSGAPPTPIAGVRAGQGGS